jgi:hypothetical protein
LAKNSRLMSRILVIEPNIMLRYGLAIALTPDHQAQFIDALPEASALKNVDGIIIDAAMLRQGVKPTPVDLKVVERWRVPTVWIDDLEPTSSPDRVDWITLKMPVQRERLLKALFDCLNPVAGLIAAGRKVQSTSAMPAKARAKKTKEPTSAAAPAANVIELVEVVEVEPENG